MYAMAWVLDGDYACHGMGIGWGLCMPWHGYWMGIMHAMAWVLDGDYVCHGMRIGLCSCPQPSVTPAFICKSAQGHNSIIQPLETGRGGVGHKYFPMASPPAAVAQENQCWFSTVLVLLPSSSSLRRLLIPTAGRRDTRPVFPSASLPQDRPKSRSRAASLRLTLEFG